MPEQLNEAWEYWMPSEEWQEAFADTKKVVEWLGDGFDFNAAGRFTCSHCGITFHGKRGANRVNRFCSPKCYYDYRRELGEDVPEVVEGRCSRCGVEFVRRWGNQVYCSRKCNKETNEKRAPRRQVPRHRRMIRMYQSGVPSSQIVKELKIWPCDLYAVLHRNAIPTRNHGFRNPAMSSPVRPIAVHVGQRVHLRGDALESSVCGCVGVVMKVEAWGVHLELDRNPLPFDKPEHKPRYRALWEELVLPEQPKPNGAPVAKAMGYTGSICAKCGSTKMVRTGTCERCEECGETSGSCG